MPLRRTFLTSALLGAALPASGQPKAIEMQEQVANFLWHYASRKADLVERLLSRDFGSNVKLAASLLNQISHAKNQYLRDTLLELLGKIAKKIDLILPDVALLSQKAGDSTRDIHEFAEGEGD